MNERIGLCPVLIESNTCPLLIPSNVSNVVFAGDDRLWKILIYNSVTLSGTTSFVIASHIAISRPGTPETVCMLVSVFRTITQRETMPKNQQVGDWHTHTHAHAHTHTYTYTVLVSTKIPVSHLSVPQQRACIKHDLD